MGEQVGEKERGERNKVGGQSSFVGRDGKDMLLYVMHATTFTLVDVTHADTQAYTCTYTH